VPRANDTIGDDGGEWLDVPSPTKPMRIRAAQRGTGLLPYRRVAWRRTLRSRARDLDSDGFADLATADRLDSTDPGLG
jgi:hypothetical protein